MDLVGDRIRALRKRNNLTLKQFAEMIGISYGHLSNIENNKDIPSKTIIKLISYEFNVSEQWIEGAGNIDNITDLGLFRDEEIKSSKKRLPLDLKKLLDTVECNDKLTMLISMVIENINHLLNGNLSNAQKLDFIEILGYYISEFDSVISKSADKSFNEIEYIDLIDELCTELKEKRKNLKNV